MAIDKLSINDQLIDNVPGAPPPEGAPNEEPRQRLIGRKLEWKLRDGQSMGKKMDSTTRIESTLNNGLHGINFGPHMTFSKLNYLASKPKPGWINISGVDWTTSNSNPSNL
jgi:hypothetical protein